MSLFLYKKRPGVVPRGLDALVAFPESGWLFWKEVTLAPIGAEPTASPFIPLNSVRLHMIIFKSLRTIACFFHEPLILPEWIRRRFCLTDDLVLGTIVPPLLEVNPSTRGLCAGVDGDASPDHSDRLHAPPWAQPTLVWPAPARPPMSLLPTLCIHIIRVWPKPP